MKTVTINKTFKSRQECDAWEKENLDKIAKCHDGVIFMVNHEGFAGADEVTLTDIVLI